MCALASTSRLHRSTCLNFEISESAWERMRHPLPIVCTPCQSFCVRGPRVYSPHSVLPCPPGPPCPTVPISPPKPPLPAPRPLLSQTTKHVHVFTPSSSHQPLHSTGNQSTCLARLSVTFPHPSVKKTASGARRPARRSLPIHLAVPPSLLSSSRLLLV